MPKKYLTLDEAAAYLEISPDELQRSFHRGLPPGKLATAVDGRLYWDQADLRPPARATSARNTNVTPDAQLECGTCGKEYKTSRGLENHISREGH